MVLVGGTVGRQHEGMEHVDLVVVGGGQSGLAAAYAARRAGRRAVVLEQSAEAVGSWPRYYDSLTLFSPARFSSLPGRVFPGDGERYPSRDEVADYLRGYGEGLDADVRTGHRVQAVTPVPGGGFRVTTSYAEFAADAVIAATGGFGNPHVPSLPGAGEFTGRILHAAEYRGPGVLAGRRVIVVGGGNSAVQIAADLAGAARVILATRGPLRWAPQRPLGRDIHWWLTRTGLDTAPIGARLRGRTSPVLDDGRYRSAVTAGRPEHRPMFTHLDGPVVRWPDGSTDQVDAIILATGYRPDLSYLEGTGALDDAGRPLHRHGMSTSVPGLGYVGLEYQRSISSATLRGVGRDAAHVVGRLHRRSTAART